MTNYVLEAALAEKDPMYDVAVVTDEGIDYWKNPQCNNINNSHSVTKFFISSAVGALTERGLMNIDKPILSYLNECDIPDGIDPGWYKVTVANALSHRTGLDTIPFGVDEDEDRARIGNDYLTYVLSLPLEKPTGEYRRYSDAAYYLLSRAASAAAGEPVDAFMRKAVCTPLQFGQWCMATCPEGYPIGGGGLFIRADDIARLAFVWVNGGRYNGNQLISESYINRAVYGDLGVEQRPGTDIFYKTGAKGQMVAFSVERRCAVAWHGYSKEDGGERNNRLIRGFEKTLDSLNK